VRYPLFGVNSTVSGVGYNVSKALMTLGDDVHFLSIVGNDLAGRMVSEQLIQDGIPSSYVIQSVEQTAHSVIIYDDNGRRQINVDLKNIQEQRYPQEMLEQALAECSAAALCNINFSRPMLGQAKRANKLIATDVHTISNLDDDYNRDFMAQADVLFMSHEQLRAPPEVWAEQVRNRYGNEIIVIGLGTDGALLSVKHDGFMERLPAVVARDVVNTIGAGDALFSCFLHFFVKTNDPYESLKKAIVFASYKVGTTGAADGFLDEKALNALASQFPPLL
jgi:ribokinase